MLASEYGWSKREVLEEIYLDELFVLVGQIRRRKMADYRVQLAIVQNPHTQDPKALWNILQEQDEKEASEKLDVAGMEALKTIMKQNPRIIVK